LILLIGGIFMGLVTILNLSSLGWYDVVPVLWSLALIAAGIQKMYSGSPEERVRAVTEFQRRVRDSKIRQ
jgi:hypothetical protein